MFKGKSGKGGKGSEFSKKYSLANTILGKGAYGKVMLGFTLKTKEKVAVKVMDKTNMLKTDHAKLYKEVTILKLLNHKNVVSVYDFYDEPEEFKIVMEYVDGGELFDKIVDDDVKFTEQQSMEYVRVIAGALKYCKEQGVIHRDIKPENILLTKAGDIKIADFNLSKQVDKETLNFSLMQTMCGTPNYVAPEVLSGKPYDYKCDIWSLGVISFLLLSGGYLPFFINPKTEGRDELLAKVKAGKWKFSPEKAWTNVSDKAKDFMTHVLVKNPKKRLTYEQLLAHPWFKISGEGLDELKAVRIDMTTMVKLNEKRRMLAASYYQTAADTFADLMGPASPDSAAVAHNNVAKDIIDESGEDIFDTEF